MSLPDKRESNLWRKPAPKKTPQGQTIEKVRIHNVAELKRMLERFKSTDNDKVTPIVIDTKGTTMADDTFSGKVTIPQSGGQSTTRTTLLEGFEMIRNHLDYHNASLASQTSPEEYGGYTPAVAPSPNDHLTWIDFFIDRNMGGKREGLRIAWVIPEGKFLYDPWTCKLEKVDA